MRSLDASRSAWKLTAVALLAWMAGAAHPQQQIPQPLPPISSRNPSAPPGQMPNSGEDTEDTMARRAMMKQAQRRNAQRQQEIVDDTAKLLSLAEQLKTEMEKNTKGQMPDSTVKKAEEIEKLAKAVKDKMRGD